MAAHMLAWACYYTIGAIWIEAIEDRTDVRDAPWWESLCAALTWPLHALLIEGMIWYYRRRQL